MKIGNIECYGVIYKITNKVNLKVYIGQTTNERGFDGRYDFSGVGIERVHKTLLCCKKIEKPYNSHLLGAIEMYGCENFEVNKVLDVAFSKQELDIKEVMYISKYKSINRNFGYNFTTGGGNGKQSKEVRLWSSLSRIGKNMLSENPRARKVICLTTLDVFDCILDGANFYNVNAKTVIGACSGKRKIGGVLPDGTRLVWMYYEDYLNNKELVDIRSDEEYSKPIGKHTQVRCITTGEIFNSVSEASEHYKMKSKGNISSCCKGKLKHCGKLEDGTKLEWEYYTD